MLEKFRPMKYFERVNNLLTPKAENKYSVLDLFAGCGGLSLGFESNGFQTIGYEKNEDACSSYNVNLKGICVHEMLTAETSFPEADVVIGGPPCQPFSVGGKQAGLLDSRNGFPICLAAVRQVQPKVFLFENVRGLMYKNRSYLDWFVKQLESEKYTVNVSLINAKQFDVPQSRERVFIIGYRKGSFNLPVEKDYLITVREALHGIERGSEEKVKYLTNGMSKYIARYEKASKCSTSRDLHLDRPARTLTCRNLAGSTGDMHRIKLRSGRRRRLSWGEASRLQSFPDWFEFSGNETSVFNQIGNAVPPMMAYHIAKSIKKYLDETGN